MKKVRDYAIAITLPFALLLGILWTYGFDFSLDGTLSWSDLEDHPTNWLDTSLHPSAAPVTWDSTIF